MKRILLIDDDADVRASISEILELTGYVVLQAGDGRKGIALAIQEKPDLVLCDIRMPGMDGFKVLETLREDPDMRVVPFIFLSARSELSETRNGMNLGADDYLTKPFHSEDLLKAVRARLARSEVLSRAVIDLGRLRDILAAARNVALITFDPRDKEQRILEFNTGAEAMFGYSRQEILQQPASLLLQRNEGGHALLNKMLDSSRATSHSTAEMTLTRKNGEIFAAIIALNPIISSQGEAVGILWVTVDISDRKTVEDQLIQARKAAEAANQAKSDFLANISHEIRTPMNAVIGFTELLGKTPLSEKQRDYVTIALESAKNLMALIDSILDFSKIEAGKLELDIHPFSLQEIMDDVIHLFSVKAFEKKLILTTRTKGNLKPLLVGDGERIRQVLMNLVSNAIKFTEQGTVVVSAVVESLVPGNVEVLVEVEDTGVGIPSEKMGLLFQRFSQVDATTTRRFGGTGLGLAICRGLIAMMGGKIHVRQALRGGTIFAFSLSLPTAPAERLSLSGKPAGQDLSVSNEPEFSGSCLVVEDDPCNRELVQEILTDLGFRTEIAVHGQEALEKTLEQAFDVVIMDCLMPVMDGFQTTREIRRREAASGGRRLPIIGLTALAKAEDREKCLQAGMDEYLAKPLHVSILKKKLAVYLKRGGAKEKADPSPA